MRPPKVILLTGDDEDRVSRMRYLLHVHKYRVVGADALDNHEQVDLVLVLWPLDGALEFLKLSKILDRSVPTLVVAFTEALLVLGPEVDSALFRDHTTSELILERIKFMAARKRGPRRGSHRKVDSQCGRTDPAEV